MFETIFTLTIAIFAGFSPTAEPPRDARISADQLEQVHALFRIPLSKLSVTQSEEGSKSVFIAREIHDLRSEARGLQIDKAVRLGQEVNSCGQKLEHILVDLDIHRNGKVTETKNIIRKWERTDRWRDGSWTVADLEIITSEMNHHRNVDRKTHPNARYQMSARP